MESQYDPLVEREFPVLTNNEFQQLVDKWNRVKIMVIGDMIADGYIEGRISRISREAPVLVLEYAGRDASAAPACGYASKHAEQQEKLLQDAFTV